MKILKTIFIVFLILLTLNLYIPKIVFAEEGLSSGDVDAKKNPPEIMATPEEDIPTKKVKKTSYWSWVLLIGLIGGAAAAGAGGGGGGKSGGGSDSGSVIIGW